MDVWVAHPPLGLLHVYTDVYVTAAHVVRENSIENHALPPLLQTGRQLAPVKATRCHSSACCCGCHDMQPQNEGRNSCTRQGKSRLVVRLTSTAACCSVR
jgi:hypothetical protein